MSFWVAPSGVSFSAIWLSGADSVAAVLCSSSPLLVSAMVAACCAVASGVEIVDCVVSLDCLAENMEDMLLIPLRAEEATEKIEGDAKLVGEASLFLEGFAVI